jgi:putative transposase
MIDRDHPLSVVRQAKLPQISRGAVYYRSRPTSEADLALMRRIDELHLDPPFMGARMLRRVVVRQGIFVGRRHLGTLMLRMGIPAMCPQSGTSQRHRQHKVYPYLLREVAITLKACHAREILEQAFARYGVPEIVNTDQGSQFTAEEFTHAVLSRGVRLSMDGKGACRDKVFVERLWRTIKYERVYLRAYDGVSAARADVAQFIDWYNAVRPHSSLGDQTPDQAYWALLPALKEAA